MSREADLHNHLDALALAGGDLDALYAAGSSAAIALAFRATDEMIGLPPVDAGLVATVTERTIAALRRCAEAGRASAWGLMAEATVHADVEQALAWWEAGALAGDDACRLAIIKGLWMRQDHAGLVRVRPLLVAAVENGSSSGAEERYLGWLAFHGIGCPKDQAESLRWHRAAAAKGDADAMFELYAMLSTGQGGALDEAEALTWCRRAAEAGSARAMANMGGFHATGRMVAQDVGLALEWYRKAAEAGSGRAAATLGVMAAQGEGAPVDEAAATRWFAQAEALGYPWWEMCEAVGLDPEAYADGSGSAL